MTPLSAFDAAAQGISIAPGSMLRAGVRGSPLSGVNDAPAIQFSKLFPYQSFLDTTLFQQAILSQPSGDQIVQSTKESQDVAGYGVGLHPSSETPVAIRFKTGNQQGASGVYHLKPGQVLVPQGPGTDGKPGQFSGFEWGLPFGWLGGGAATLIVFRTANATVNWVDHAEVVFHRMTLPVLDLASVAAISTAASKNWPTRFPWRNAVHQSGLNQLSQGGLPVLSVAPTRTLMRLRMANLAAQATMRMYFVGSDVFDIDSAGNTILNAEVAAVDVTWGTWTSLASAQYASQYQTLMLTGESERIGANDGAVILVENAPGTLVGEFVDIIRYGRL